MAYFINFNPTNNYTWISNSGECVLKNSENMEWIDASNYSLHTRSKESICKFLYEIYLT